MQNFHKIVKQFAEWHPDMLHSDTGNNKRFFQIRSIVAMSDFTKTLPKNQSPCVAVDINPDMQIRGLKRGWRHTVFFLVRNDSKKVVDADAESETIEAGYQIMNTFVAWCNEHYQRHEKDFLGLEWDGAQGYPYGPLADGWYAVCLDMVDWVGADDRLAAWSDKTIDD